MTVSTPQVHDARAACLVAGAELGRELAGDVDARPQMLDVRWGLTDPPGAGRDRYLAGHLPGARFLDLEGVLTQQRGIASEGRHPLPDLAVLEAGLGALGIDPARPIVVYDEPGSFAAGRAWWVLRWAGLAVRVLDGGMDAWLAAGGDLETGEVPTKPTDVSLTLGHLSTVDADQVAAFAGPLLDARAAERFRGEVEPIDPKAGHIPGAINVPVTEFFGADGTLPPPDALRSLLAPALNGGGAAPRPIAVYCGSGVSAAQVILALASLGLEAALYPASWSGWSSDPRRPVAVGA